MSQSPGMNSGQRGWNGQPIGRLYGWGIEPAIVGRMMREDAWMLGIERSRTRLVRVLRRVANIAHIGRALCVCRGTMRLINSLVSMCIEERQMPSGRGLVMGTAVAAPGELVYGHLDVMELPNGVPERLPVLIAQGQEDGPTLWLTANIHGAEYAGIPSIHRIMTPALPARLRGTVVALPSLNPSGLRIGSRTASYDPIDPNRTYPMRQQADDDSEESKAPLGVYEQIAATIWGHIKPSADLLLDLHNASIGSVPFTIRDRVLYDGEADRPRADALATKLDDLARIFGLSLVNEANVAEYVRKQLHRSVAGAAVNEAGIPALTLELGMGIGVDWPAVEAAARGIENTLIWAGMVEGEVRAPAAVTVVHCGFPVKRDDTARARVTGLVAPLLQPGDRFSMGDVLATMTDLWGRQLPDGEIRAPADGWLIGWSNNLLKYRGQIVAALAVRDDDSLVAAFPPKR